ETVLLKNALFRVDDGQGTARGIAGGDGGTIHHGQVQVGCRRPYRVQDLAATRANDYLGVVLTSRRLDPFDLGMGAFAPEGVNGMVDAGFSEGGFPGVRQQADGRTPGEDERRTPQAEPENLLTQGGRGVFSLRVPTRGTEHGKHGVSLLA